MPAKALSKLIASARGLAVMLSPTHTESNWPVASARGP